MKRQNDNFLDLRRNFMSDLDPDLKEFFAQETGLIKKNSKKKKKVAKFKIGDSVETSGTFATIIFGPYEDAFNNEVYEIETEDNKIITVASNSIQIYVAPVEEVEDEDLL